MSYYARKRVVKRKRVTGGWSGRRKRYTGQIYAPPPPYVRTRPTENKFKDSAKDDAVIAANGAITTSLNLVAQNVTEQGRIGRKITITKIQCSFSIFLAAEADVADLGTGDVVRIMLFVDKQCNGADTTVGTILENTEFDSYRNLASVTRFRILFDKTYAINRRVAMTDGTNTGASPLCVLNLVRINRNVNIPIEFDSTTGAITEVRTNNVGLLYISKHGVAGIDTKCRIRYSG